MHPPTIPQEGATKGAPTDPRLFTGCMLLGGAKEESDLDPAWVDRTLAMIDASLDCGVNAFDHADIYRRGRSELAFGLALAQRPGLRDRLFLQSKCGIRPADTPAPGAPQRYDFSREHIIASVEGSLARLRTDRLDALLLHRPDALCEPEEVAAAFADLHRAGKVLRFGVSNHNTAQVERLAAALPFPLFANQVEFSLLRHELVTDGFLANRPDACYTGAHGLLDTCARLGIALQAWAPLAQGRIVDPAPEAPPRCHALAAALRRVAAGHSVHPETVAVAWILRHPAGIRPVTGTTSPERLRRCAAALNLRLSREEWYALVHAARGVPLP